jgi:hypothetical protein
MRRHPSSLALGFRRPWLFVLLAGLALLGGGCAWLPPSPTAITPVSAEAVTPGPTVEGTAAGLFPIAWDNRTVFAADLIPVARDALQKRPGASVYHLDLSLSDDWTRLTGRQAVRYTNTESVSLREVYFRLFPNIAGGETIVHTVTVDGLPVRPRYELQDSALVVPLVPPLPPGEAVVIGLDFAVTVPTRPGGNYGTFALMDEVLALAHAYPLIPAYDKEGWNVEIAPAIGDVVYADASYYLVRLDAPADLVIATSGRVFERVAQGDRVVYTVAAGPVRDFYLAASPRYQLQSTTAGETTVRSWAPPGAKAAAARVLDIAATALALYNQRFGPYPFTELDVVATPTLAGGVEYPGIIAVAQSLYNPTHSFLETVVAHEVAHQWFYSLIGNDQVDEPWLDEALAQYATWVYYRDRYGETEARWFEENLRLRWQQASDPDRPIGLPVAAYDERDYSAIVYGRGPLFVDALARTLGEEAFAAFLQDYSRTFAWDTVTTADFQRLAEGHCGCDLTPLFAEWVYPRPEPSSPSS